MKYETAGYWNGAVQTHVTVLDQNGVVYSALSYHDEPPVIQDARAKLVCDALNYYVNKPQKPMPPSEILQDHE